MIAFSIPVFLSYTAVSEQVGCLYWVPSTFWTVRIFPTRLSFFDVSNSEEREVCTLVLGYPHVVELFRVECQWDRQRLLITLQGGQEVSVLSVQMYKVSSVCALCLLRGSSLSVHFLAGEEIGHLSKKEWIKLSFSGECHRQIDPLPLGSPIILPKLSFGSNKKKCFSSFYKKIDLKYILPCLYALASLVPCEIKKNIVKCLVSNRLLLSTSFVAIWRYHFSKIAVPSWKDQQFFGTKHFFEGEGSPLGILTYFGKVILDSIFRMDETTLFFLSDLPSWSVSGRLRHLSIPFGSCSLMWSRRRLRYCVLTVIDDFICDLVFSPDIKGFRATRKGGGPGMCHIIGSERVTFVFKSGDIYCFDRFEH